MNIIYFSSSTNKSGGTRQALYLARGMEERGHTVRFFVPRKSNLPALYPDWPAWGFLDQPKTWRKSLETAMQQLEAPVVVHAFHNAAVKRLSWWGILWKRHVVSVAHRGVIFRPNNPLPYWSPGIDAFLVNSNACAAILGSMGLSKKRIRLVPNSVPDERLRPTRSREEIRAALGMAEDDVVFGTIADSSPVKGAANLLEAFGRAFSGAASVPEKGTDLSASFENVQDAGLNSSGKPHLLVQGPSPSLCPDWLKASPLMERIHFLPHGENIADSLAAMDCFVLPSLSESMPNTLLEAVRFGLPAIGSTVGAVEEILASCGLPVPPGDITALENALVRMAGDKALRVSLAENAKVRGEDYRPEKRLDLVESIYSDLLHARRFATQVQRT